MSVSRPFVSWKCFRTAPSLLPFYWTAWSSVSSGNLAPFEQELFSISSFFFAIANSAYSFSGRQWCSYSYWCWRSSINRLSSSLRLSRIESFFARSLFSIIFSCLFLRDTGNPNAVWANRKIRCIFAVLANKIIRCIYLYSCVCMSRFRRDLNPIRDG